MHSSPFSSRCAALALLTAFLPDVSRAGSITVDPSTTNHATALDDWGIGFSGGTVDWPASFPAQTDLNPDPGVFTTTSGFRYDYVIEDFVKSNGKVGPRFGGQDYDAEFLGIGRDDSMLYVAIVSGQRPDNDPENYSPGDLFITTADGTMFAVELTGQTFDLVNNTGHTIPTATTTTPPMGNVYKGILSDWLPAEPTLTYTGALENLNAVQIDPENLPMLAGTANVYFSGNNIGSIHSVFEIAISLSLFGGSSVEDVHWSPSCGNDVLYRQDLGISTVPEPSSLALLGFGALFGGVTLRRRRKQGVAG